MPNTSLRTDIQAGTTGRIAETNIVHGEVNRLSYDSGWRDVSGWMQNGWALRAGGFFHVRRIVDRVYWRVRDLDGSAATSNLILQFASTPSTTVLSHGLNADADSNGRREWMSPMFRPSPAPDDVEPWWFYLKGGWLAVRTGSTIAPITWSGDTAIRFDYLTQAILPSALPPVAAQ